MLYATDKMLVRRLLSGDDRAFEQFFEDHFAPLYRLALVRLNGNVADAEEVAQAALCRAIGKLETYRAEAALGTWLASICRHEIWELQRRHRRRPQVSLTEDTLEIRNALDSLAAVCRKDPESEARRSEIARLVQVALDRLPPHYGRVLEWKYLKDMAIKEIAIQMDLSPKATESLLTRARVAFRDAFSTLTDSDPAQPALRPVGSEQP